MSPRFSGISTKFHAARGLRRRRAAAVVRRHASALGIVSLAWLLAGTRAWTQAQLVPLVVEAAATLPDAPLPSSLQSVTPGLPAAAPTGSIVGVVTDADGNLLVSARVRLVHGAEFSQETRSDAQGRFTFLNVPAGAFEITYSASGFATQVKSGTLHPGEIDNHADASLSVATSSNVVVVTETREEIAEEQIQVQEKQRVFGVVPNFYVSYNPHAVPLTPRQKFELGWKSTIDPFNWAILGVIAGIEQADDGFNGYGQGAQGYAKRYGAAFADSTIGTALGGVILPIALRQDPRYFVKGTGTVKSRILYAMSQAVVCKGDNGHWQPNYSGILGGMATAGISNLYYPAADRNGLSLTVEQTLIGIAASIPGNLFQEFLVKKLTPKTVSPNASNAASAPKP